MLLHLLTVLAISWCQASLSGAAAVATATDRDSDHSNRCKWLDETGRNVTRFSVLPGSGWDNLRNRDMGMVADLTFTDCTLSDDGTYVTPRHVILYPKRESQVSLMSQLMEHYDNYTSSTSSSVNLGGNGLIHGFSLDGKLSEEFQSVKKTALSSRTQIGRTQQRYNMYTAQLQPGFSLSENFVNRLTEIGNALIDSRTAMARYLSDLIVRDFGTHVVTSVDAGAILEKLDYFNRNSLTTSVFNSNKISLCMSVGFAGIFGVKSDSSITVTNEELKQYITSVQKTTINTHGGPPVGAKINLDDWEARLRENLVAIDKIGDPLYGVISEQTLPQIPVPYLTAVIDSVKDAVLRYYKANEVKGCLDPNSPSFDSLANVEGLCKPTLTNFSFAGVYQTCQESRPELGLGICGRGDSPVQRNPITGDFTCPMGYEAVKLVTAVGGRDTRCYRRTKSCWVVFTCDDGQDCYDSQAMLTSYWCSAVNGAKLPQNSGMFYGGAYSPRFNNPETDAKTCGAGYRAYTVARDISLCLSADMGDAAATRLPLGGFFSCQWGNPLADAGRQVVTLGAAKGRLGGVAVTSDAPQKQCPSGFSQSTLDLIDGCALMQCTKGPAEPRDAVAKRPPFEAANFPFAGPPVTTVLADGRIWRYNATAWVYGGYVGLEMETNTGIASTRMSSATGGSSRAPLNNPNSGLPIGGLVALLAVIGLVIVAAIAYAYRKRLSRSGADRRRGAYRCVDENASDALVAGGGEGGGGYGALKAEVTAEGEPSAQRV